MYDTWNDVVRISSISSRVYGSEQERQPSRRYKATLILWLTMLIEME